MRKRYGFASGIVYTQPITYGIGKAPACDQRLRVKEWAYRQFGKPAYILYGDIMGADSEWFAAVTKPDEYTIAFKNAKYRNLALLM
jgi:hypothetical protein